ncbi:MAG: HD domain-containing protein [Caldilineaceae bacterium]|nr:HD domain-containing protein [Caldilineaceae bacterium]
MRINDRIYGPVDLQEPVLIDLLNTTAVRRLDGVLQHGISALVGLTSQTTRLEHSLGAMLLVRRLGAALPEQIAALLHDISHTAMSHVIDYVYARHDSQSYHDEMKAWFVGQSDLPALLTRHGYRWQDFLDESSFALLEQPAPTLCADRLDYFLRDGLDLGVLAQVDIDYILARLTVFGGRIAVTDREAARRLAYGYIAADAASWSNFREVGLYEVTAQALRWALQQQLITDADIWGTDALLWQKLQQSQDPSLRSYLSFIMPATQFVRDAEKPTFWVTTKIRTLDPHVLEQGELVPYSILEPAFAAYRQAYVTQKQGAWPVRVVGFDPSVVRPRHDR